MFLNVINKNLFKNKKNENILYNENTDEEKQKVEELNLKASDFSEYNSLFYGYLTNNWIRINK